VILMENKESKQVLGSRDAPYLNGLARSYTTATSFYGIRHPSLPNYLALTGGSTFGITSDCTSCRVSSSNLVDQLEAAGVSWRAYMDSMPRPCFNGGSRGDYAKKHNPFMYYDDVRSAPARCANVVPGSQLTADLSTGLPSFVWITPNLCDDMHDCGVRTGDKYLSKLVPKLLPKLGPRGALFVLWDEGTSDNGCCRLAHGGHIPAVFAGPAVRRSSRVRIALDHYSVLRAIEDAFGAPHLRGAGVSATPSLAPVFSAKPWIGKGPPPG
jgi:phosphatidylinositol-3-phosphatase